MNKKAVSYSLIIVFVFLSVFMIYFVSSVVYDDSAPSNRICGANVYENSNLTINFNQSAGTACDSGLNGYSDNGGTLNNTGVTLNCLDRQIGGGSAIGSFGLKTIANDSLIKRCNVYSFGFHLNLSSNNVSIIDSKFDQNNPVSKEIWVGANFNATLLNTTFTESKVQVLAGSNLSVQYYVIVNVTNASGTGAVVGANVSISNSSHLLWSTNTNGTTDSSGFARFNVTERMIFNGGNFNFTYVVNASVLGNSSSNLSFDPVVSSGIQYVHLSVTAVVLSDTSPPNFTNIATNHTFGVINQFINFSAFVADNAQVARAWLSHNFDLTDKQRITQNAGTTGIAFGNNSYVAQTFSWTNGSWYFREVCTRINYGGTGLKANVTFELRATSAAIPTGKNITSKIQLDYNLIGTSPQVYCLNFTRPVSLAVSPTLWSVVISSQSSASGVYLIRAGGAYAGGTRRTSADNGTTWSAGQSDMVFNFTGSNYDQRNETAIVVNAASADVSQVKRLLWASNSPFSYRWCGNDSSNNQNCSLTQSFTVLENAPVETDLPSGSIIAPPNNTRVNGNVTIDGTATDTGSGINYAYFQIKNSTAASYSNISGCTLLSSPFDCSWNTSSFVSFNSRIFSNNTVLDFIVSTANQTHNINVSDTNTISNAYNINLTINFSLTIGNWEVWLNNVFVGNITTGDSSPKRIGNINVNLVKGKNNITFTPEVATTGTITQTNLSYDIFEDYDIKIVPVDNNNNQNTSTMPFRYAIDRQIPIEIARLVIYPVGQSSVRNGQNILFKINVTDQSGAGINVSRVDLLLLNGTRNTSMLFESGSLATGQFSFWNISTNLSVGTTGLKQIPFFIFDNVTSRNNLFYSTFSAQIDVTFPNWTNINKTVSDPIYNDTEVGFTVNGKDNFNLSYYIFSNNFSGTWINITTNFTGIDETDDFAGNSSVLRTGTYQWYFILYDDAGNSNTTSTQSVTILGASPQDINITQISPIDKTNTSSTSNTFQYNYTGASASSCLLLVDIAEVNKTNNPANDTTLSFTNTIGEGIHSWEITCNNTDNNFYFSGERIITVDFTNPNVTLLTPTNASYVNNQTQNFTANLTDNLGIKNATLYIYNNSNFLVNQTTTDFSQGIITTVVGVVVNLVDGIYKWFYQAIDWAGNTFSSPQNYTVIIDSTIPSTITFVNPTAANNANVSANFIVINVTSSDLNLANITIRLYNSSRNQINITNNTTSPLYINFSGLSDGVYYYNATSTDLANNMNDSATRAITLDTLRPVLNFTFPTPQDGINISVNHFLINISINETYLSNITYFLYNSSNFTDNFGSYSVGNDTMRPIWVPQYAGLVNITSSGEMLINAYTPFGGDRDIHVALNRTDIIPNSADEIDMQWEFNVTSCNSTWKLAEGVTPQGAVGYLHYNNPQDFLDAEFKIFANNTDCGSGTAQLSAFKRVGGVSTALIPFTQYAFLMNQTYTARVILARLNLTTYNYTIYLNGTLLASSINITTAEIKPGQTLLENAGTITKFDNVVVKAENGLLQNSTTYTTSQTTMNFTSLSHGIYRYFVEAYDSSSNRGTTESRTLNVSILDLALPIVNLIAPLNNTNQSSTSQSFNSTFSDDVALANATFYLWNSTLTLINTTTQSKSGTSGGMNLTVSLPYDGRFYWNYLVCDSSNNCAMNNSNFTFFLDSTPSTIQFVDPTKANGTIINVGSFAVNITASDSGTGINNITVRLYNSTRSLINNSFSLTSPLYINYTSLGNGIFYYNATVYDNAGNQNSTETRTIQIDLVTPTATPISPASGSSSSGSPRGSGTVNYTTNVTDATNGTGVKNVTIKIYNNATGALVNQTTTTEPAQGIFSKLIGFVVSLADGVYTWFVEVFDFAGNSISSSNSTITIDTKNSTILFVTPTPANATYISQNSFVINVSGNETNRDSVWFVFNGTTFTPSCNNLGGGLYSCNRTITSIVDGVYNYTGYINDTSGNTNQTEQRFITIDTTNPSVSISSPTANQNFTTTSVTVNFTATDTNRDACWSTKDSGVTNTSQSCASGSFGDTYSQGTNTVVVYSNDSAGNSGSASVAFFVDSIDPSISYGIGTESDGSTLTTRNNTIINVTVSDTNYKNVTIRLFNSTHAQINSTNSTLTTLWVNYTNLKEGVYYFNATAFDLYGNKASTSTRTVTINLSATNECGTNPIEGCIVSVTTTFNRTTYRFNGTASNGIINVLASNIVADANASTFIGNNSNRGYYITSVSNSTIRNITISNYTYSFQLHNATSIIFSNLGGTKTFISNSSYSSLYLSVSSSPRLFNSTLRSGTIITDAFINATLGRNDELEIG